MENVVIFYFYFPYFIYKTAKRFENGNLVEVFSFSYLRHIIDLMIKPGVCDLEYYYHFAMSNICLRRKLGWPQSPLTRVYHSHANFAGIIFTVYDTGIGIDKLRHTGAHALATRVNSVANNP